MAAHQTSIPNGKSNDFDNSEFLIDFGSDGGDELNLIDFGEGDHDESNEEDKKYIVQNHNLKELRNKQELLNDSVLSLSTQFAQIQYRLKQIEKVPNVEDQARLISEIKTIAFQECTSAEDMNALKETISQNDANNGEVVESCKKHQNKLIEKLRCQLQDLESFAYKHNNGDLPSDEIMSRQKTVLEKMTQKLQLKIDIDKIQDTEMFSKVDDALQSFLCPIVEQEKLVEQLTTQIIDLERFVNFLQLENGGASSGRGSAGSVSRSSNSPSHQKTEASEGEQTKHSYSTQQAFSSGKMFNSDRERNSSLGSYIGLGKKFERNELKNTLKGNHYGDQRAKLELAVGDLKELMDKSIIFHIEPMTGQTAVFGREFSFSSVDLDDDVFDPNNHPSTPSTTIPSQISEEPKIILDKSDIKIVAMVRKEFCTALKDLLFHGVRIVPLKSCEVDSILNSISEKFGGMVCSSRKSRKYVEVKSVDNDQVKNIVHIWDVISFYFYSRHARQFEDIPVRKLSQSFNLDNVSGKTITSKQVLLSTIENIISSHRRLKRSPDAMWKAFVCAALNKKKLPAWIRMIFRTRIITECCYHSWSYIARTGCEDVYNLLETLHQFTFTLPVDLAIRPFNQLMDAF
uniref:RUN domain-containing protein n=1 Tax=Rhabditophanes sp. KR3021 TaxID=114890 RepID=A0AC35TYT7_9BILA